MKDIHNSNKEFCALGFGEVMLRLSPGGKERISQCETFEKKAGGSELNVVSGISQLGLRTGVITKLPDNEIGKFIKNKIRYSGISDDYIVYDTSSEKRLGIYYSESGAYPRVPTVVYDRRDSSFTKFVESDINDDVYSSCDVFHVSGITIGLCENIRNTVIEMIKKFKENGAAISFDVNYRANLWDEETARKTINTILPYVDILFVSEETLRKMFRQTGTLKEIQKNFTSLFPDIAAIFSTVRTVTSPTRHNFTSLAYDCEEQTFYEESPYMDIEVVDRIGSGDAYVAGALFGLLKFQSLKEAVKFGNAMAAVKNTIPGDMTACDYNDIARVIDAHTKGRTSEMVR